MRSVFASFATENFADKRDGLCNSALNVGFSEVRRWSPSDYANTAFAEKNKHILSQSRGAGYWLWKPYLILQELKAMSPSDLLVYCDAGGKNYYSYALNQFPNKLANLAINTKQGFLLGPALYQHGPLTRWTKRDCLILLGMDNPDTLKKPTIQAAWSFWTPTDEAIGFLEKWIDYASDERCLTDISNTLGMDNYDDFVAHRHDQSILTLLAYKYQAQFLDFRKTGLFRILGLRPKSGLANQFLRRIDDSERMLRGEIYLSLFGIIFELLRRRF